MKYGELKLQKPKPTRRVGRGIAAGQGKTAGRGTKGQKARTGATRKPGFAGGQNPLMQQLPKLPGFRSYRVKPTLIYTYQLDRFSGKTVTNALLAAEGLIENKFTDVKLLLKGPVTKKVTITLQGVSQNAKAAVQEAGGSFEKVARPAREKAAKTTKSK